MTDATRPGGGATELRGHVEPTDTSIPVLSSDPFNLAAKFQIGRQPREYVRCTSKSVGWLHGCTRGISREEGGSAAQEWEGGTPLIEMPWTAVEILTDFPTATEGMIGRTFIYRDSEGNSYTFSVGVSQDGTPAIDWVNEPPVDPNAEPGTSLALSMAPSASSFHTGFVYTTGVAHKADGTAEALTAWPETGSQKYLRVQYDGAFFVDFTANSEGTVVGDWAAAPTWVGDNLWIIVGSRLRRYIDTGSSYAFDVSVSHGASAGQNLSGMAYDPNNGVLWLAHWPTDTLQKRNATTGALITSYTLTGRRILALHWGPDGFLWGSDTTNGKIVKMSTAGGTPTVSAEWGVEGIAAGQISDNILGLAVNADGYVFVSDHENHRVSVFESDGTFVTSVGTLGSGTQNLNKPLGGSINAQGHFIVADMENDRWQDIMLETVTEIELGFEAYTWDEEFIGGGTTSGAVGERGWISAGNGSVSVQTSTATHPGIVRVSSGGTSGNSQRLTLGPWLLPQIDKMDFIFAPASNGTTASTRQAVGLGTTDLGSGSPGEGVTVEYDTNTSTSFLVIKRYAAGVSATQITTVPFVAGEYYLCRFEPDRDVAGNVKVTIVRLSNGVSYSNTRTGASTTTAFDASFVSRTMSNNPKTLDAEYWSGSFSGLTRA